MNYKTKPEIVEAFQLTWESVLETSPIDKQLPRWVTYNPNIEIHAYPLHKNSEYLIIKNQPGGELTVKNKDWLVKHKSDRLEVYGEEAFERSFQAASEKEVIDAEINEALINQPVENNIKIIKGTVENKLG